MSQLSISRRSRLLALFAVLVLSLAVSPVQAATPSTNARDAAHDSQITVLLNGQAITADQMTNYFCDDRAYPVFHCYTSFSAMAADLGSNAATSQAVSPAKSGNWYATVYQDNNYSGAALAVTQSYLTMPGGWNDQISSSINYSGYNPCYWQNAYYGGSGWMFGWGVWIPSYGAYGFNDTVSSIQQYC
jgi:hypothetical protein